MKIVKYYGVTDIDIGKWEFWRFQYTIDDIKKQLDNRKIDNQNLTL